MPRRRARGAETARRLLMVVHGPYPVSEVRVAREARVALDEGFAVDVVAMRLPGEPSREVVDGVEVFRLPLSHRRGARFHTVVAEYLGFTALASIRVAALAWTRRYAAVQVHNPPDFLVVVALFPKLLGARVILDIHDFAPDLFAMRFAGRRGVAHAERVLRRIEGWAVRLSDRVVTAHEPYQRALQSRGAPGRKVVTVANSIDERLLPEPREPDPDSFRIVYHGTITPHYGVELLAKAAARVAEDVPALRLELYGDGDALPEVRRLVASLGLADWTHVSGRYLPHREVLACLPGAAVGVISNLAIPRNAPLVPTKIFEYVALGIPVVSADLPGIREHFGEDEVLFFRPGDAEALAEALLAVARNPASASARADAALERFENYRWARSAERYAAVLDEIARGAGLPKATFAR